MRRALRIADNIKNVFVCIGETDGETSPPFPLHTNEMEKKSIIYEITKIQFE